MAPDNWDTEKSVKAIQYGILVEKSLSSTRQGYPRVELTVTSHRDQRVRLTFRDILPVEFSDDSIHYGESHQDCWTRITAQELEYEGIVGPDDSLEIEYWISEPNDVSVNQFLVTPKIDGYSELSDQPGQNVRDVSDVGRDPHDSHHPTSTENNEARTPTSWSASLRRLVLRFAGILGLTGWESANGDSGPSNRTGVTPSESVTEPWDPPLLDEIDADPEVARHRLIDEINGNFIETIISELTEGNPSEESVEMMRSLLRNGSRDLDEELTQIETRLTRIQYRVDGLEYQLDPSKRTDTKLKADEESQVTENDRDPSDSSSRRREERLMTRERIEMVSSEVDELTDSVNRLRESL